MKKSSNPTKLVLPFFKFVRKINLYLIQRKYSRMTAEAEGLGEFRRTKFVDEANSEYCKKRKIYPERKFRYGS